MKAQKAKIKGLKDTFPKPLNSDHAQDFGLGVRVFAF